MGWNGSLTASSEVGAVITFTPDTSTEGGYTVSSFVAPKKGIYRFQLYGSGGTKGYLDGTTYVGAGGQGGYTDGYLLLEKDQTIYVGAGGTCSAAFVSSATGTKLSAISKSSLYFVAGAGGGGGAAIDNEYGTGWNCCYVAGGIGGGTSGGTSQLDYFIGGTGGSQTSGGTAGGESGNLGGNGAYGVGGTAGIRYDWGNYVGKGGRGGDGYYGGGGGHGFAYYDDSLEVGGGRGYGGGGGSGYVKTASLTVGDKTYTSTTVSGSGSASNTKGKVIVTYYARTELPVVFNGTTLEKIIFNGVEITSLIYNGTKLF